MPSILNYLLPPPTYLPPPIPFIQDNINIFIKNLQQGKVPGKDEITNQVIQAEGPMLAKAICGVTNSCMKSGFFPSSWNTARTAILRKPHKLDYADPTAYRSIALLSCLGKVVEAVIARRFKSQAESRDILPSGHYGGRPQFSTEDALTHLKTWTKDKWSKGEYVGALFVDVKAAFHIFNPSRLVNTLLQQGFCPTMTNLVVSYLYK